MVRTINFVALGDSLTVGFIPEDFLNYPYTEFLEEMVDDFLKRAGWNDFVEIAITNMGINGQLTVDMLLRFRRDVVALKPDYVIILGGTNDLGWGVPVAEIFSALSKMFQMAKDNKIGPIGCTVPSVLGWDEGIPPRLRLNELLTSFCHEKQIPCADIFAKTCDPETRRLRADYSSDGLHQNALGYKRIAETIFEDAIRPILIKELNVKQ